MSRSTMISRRTCLRGLGMAIALPLLETMAWADTPGKSAKSPVRLAFISTSYGFGRVGGKWDPWFWPKDAAAFSPTGTLSPVLEGLRPMVSESILIGGMSNDGHKTAGHVSEEAHWLTCAGVTGEKQTEEAKTVNIGISADQAAALQLGLYTSLPSLELGVSRCNLSGLSEFGYAAAYQNTISYRSATQPLPSDNNPRSVLNRLFSTRRSIARKGKGPAGDTSQFAAVAGGSAAEGPSLDQSMLDLVMESTSVLRKHISGADQQTLDQYLDGMRSLEKRVVAIERQQAEAARAQSSKAKPRTGKYSDPIEITLPATTAIPRTEHVRLMSDLMILAFQADITRVATLPFCLPYDGSTYPELGFTEDFHACTHMENDGDKHKKIDQFHLKQLSYVLARMKSLNDGNGTLLDNSIVLFGSGMANWSHDVFHNMPTIVAGRGGGTINPGRYIQAKGNMGDLLTAILARAGCTLEKPFGNGTKLFPDLS